MPSRAADRGSVWDSDLVAGVAFHPRKCAAEPRGGAWIDSDLAVADGIRLAYRLYTPAAPVTTSEAKANVLVYFHANAELCTDIKDEVRKFYDCGYRAVLCPEFRGFAWSTGKPSLRALCPDAEAVMKALPEILAKAGLEADAVRIVLHGRSLGTICAVHLASLQLPGVAALIVESGVMNLLKLPMVMQLSAMMPQMLRLLMNEPSPLHTLEEMGQVTVPTLIIHGDLDEVSPVDQAVAAHKACASSAKKLVRYPRARHNDLRTVARSDYFRELQSLSQVLSSGGDVAEAFRQNVSNDSDGGFLGMISGAFRCFPAMRRCLAESSEDTGVESPR